MDVTRETEGATPRVVVGVFLAALAGVAITRWPVARVEAFDPDEFLIVGIVRAHWFFVYHTLFLTAGRLFGEALGDAYRGFVVLDMVTSAVALTAVWWWLRALVRPATAALATLALGAAPLFWGYGAMAGNYTAAVAVGSFLLGVAVRTWRDPKPWHPYAAAAVLALGTGYRHDVGTLWLPVLFVILWPHRWTRAAGALAVFTMLNLTWIGLMLREAGGWSAYRESTREFAYQAGYLNSVWNLGLVDASLRYALKLVMALLWTFGPGLIFAPRVAGSAGPGAIKRGLAGLLILSTLPALALHLTVHFGVPGYAFHYVPALVALIALGIGRVPCIDPGTDRGPRPAAAWRCWRWALAAVFLFYPTDFNRPGFRGDFDLAFARHTRVGLRTRPPLRHPSAWRTANSRPVGGGGVPSGVGSARGRRGALSEPSSSCQSPGRPPVSQANPCHPEMTPAEERTDRPGQ